MPGLVAWLFSSFFSFTEHFLVLLQLLVGTGDARDVTLNVNLAGIRLLDPKNEVRGFSIRFDFTVKKKKGGFF